MPLRIAILGTRGIPNNYGGFEQFAEHLSAGLVDRGHSVTVYNSHLHPYKKDQWNAVKIIHCFDPEKLIGAAGQFIYDLNCILDTRKRKFDVILQLGYTSSSVWGDLLPKKSVSITNMDGIEWKRSKYSKPVKRFLKYAESLAVRKSDFLVADSLEIMKYLKTKYDLNINYIPYGAAEYCNEDEKILSEYCVTKRDFSLLMARMEPENNIETVLDGVHSGNSKNKFVVIGDITNRFGKYIFHKYKNDDRIQFTGSIFHPQKVHTLRTFSHLYFHGHSVGGTNPSLLEAMSSKALIAAHDNPFNKSVLQNDALYFSDASDVKRIIETDQGCDREQMVSNNFCKIKDQFNWQTIISQYEDLMLKCCYDVPTINNVPNETIAFN